MRKNGFTLMEILLALGIVGVLAAVLMKVLTGVAPDVGKAKFLKAYSTTRLVVADMINDTTLYPDMDENSDKFGFANTDMPAIGLYKDPLYSGKEKFINIFADKLNAKPTNGQFFSPRDGLYYVVTSEGNPATYTIKYCTKSNCAGKDNVHFASAKVSNDGDVTCENSDVKKYCETEDNPLHDLRQNKLN